MARDKYQMLEEFRLRRQDRTLCEAAQLLAMFGFAERKAKIESSVRIRGSVRLTLPTPHGRCMKVPYVRLLIRKIEEAELLAHQGGRT